MANTQKKWLGIALVGAMTLAPMSAFADDVAPADVTNLVGTPGDSEVTLNWDPATDDTGTTGYFVYYGLETVPGDADEYTFAYVDAGDTTEYTVDRLTNGQTYYFAAVAYDAAGNTSQFFSNEVEVTPEEGETGDFTAPTVSAAEALTTTLVEVEFSEGVTLPDDASSAFSIEATDGSMLEVLDAYVTDVESVVLLVTAEQTAGAQYLLTASSSVSDLAENPLTSGTSDTALFTGSALDSLVMDEEEEEDVEDSEDMEETEDEMEVELERDMDNDILDVDAEELNELMLEFLEDVDDLNPEDVAIQWMEDATVEVEVLAVMIDTDDRTQVTLLTEEMEAGQDYLLTIDFMGISAEFRSVTLDLEDLIAPEDVTDFLAGIAGEDSVMLSWTASEDSAGDLAEYLVYMAEGLDSMDFGRAKSVQADETQYEWDGLEAGESYTFKVTAVDENGNESEGVISTVTLPEAGPGMWAMGALSLAGAGFVTRRRRRD